MKIVVIGGSGLIGTKLVNELRQHGHEVVAASPASVSIPSLARDWLKLLQALKLSWTLRIRLRSRTRLFWNSSRRPVVTF
jgi:nucleoside-diphosphate-sugar epimerase